MACCAAAVGVALLLAGGAWSAAEAPVIKHIEIRNQGSGRIDEGLILTHTSQRVGQPFDNKAVAGDMKSLLGLDRFSHVNISAEPLDDGIRLVYSLRKRLRLREPPRVLGVDHLSESKVRKLLDLQVDDPVDDQVLGVRSQAVLEKYRDAYFPEAALAWSIDEAGCPDGYARVTVTVAENRRSSMAGIVFVGNDSVPDGVFRKAMQNRAWYNPMRWFGRRAYDKSEMEAGMLAVRDVYLELGHLDVSVEMAEPDVDAEGNLIVTIIIKEGRRYRFGKVSLHGVTIFPRGELFRLITARTEKTASSLVLGESVRALRDFYGSRGYIQTQVRVGRDADPATGIVDVRFDLVAGKLTKIRNIHIRGNTTTRDKVIRRELRVYPGDIYNEVSVRQSEGVIRNLGYFGEVRSHPEPTDKDDEKNLILEVAEKRTGTFLVGAGFSSIDQLLGFVEISQGNFDISGWPFTGAGQKLKLRAQAGSTRKNYELSFYEPWFLDRRLGMGVDLYRTEYDYDEFDIERTGVGLRLSKALPGPNRVSLKYLIEEYVLDDYGDTDTYVDIVTDEEVLFEREDDIKSQLRLTLTHDTRNHPFVPTGGRRASIFAKMAGGPLGLDTDVFGLGIRAKQYVPLWYGHVLSIYGRYETIDGYGDTGDDIPIAERLFIGGPRTIRGYDLRDVGPKARPEPDDGSHRPYGGRSLGMASLEYIVPIVDGVRFAGFFDAGNVWHDSYDLDLGNLATSGGVGIRLDLPGFPIRIDRAWTLDKDHEITDEEHWVFWIGYDQ
jgi:outer membrane protein insertion porin family